MPPIRFWLVSAAVAIRLVSPPSSIPGILKKHYYEFGAVARALKSVPATHFGREGQMEIKIVARILGVEDRTTNRDSFWAEVQRRSGRPPESTDAFAAEREKAIVQDLPSRLRDQIWSYIQQHELPKKKRSEAGNPEISRASLIGDHDFAFAVKSIRYGSLELLLEFIAGKDFPLSAADVVQILSMYAPPAVQAVVGLGPILGVNVEQIGATPSGDTGTGGEQAKLLSRAFYLANYSLVVPVGLALWVLYLAYTAMTAERTALQQDRQELVKLLLNQTDHLDKDRSQLVKDALDLVKEARRGGTGGGGNGSGGGTTDEPGGGAGGGNTSDSDKACPGGKKSGRGFILCFTNVNNVNVDFSGLAKTLLEESVKAGKEAAKGVIETIGLAFDTAGKGVRLGSDVVDLWRKIFTESCPKLATTVSCPVPTRPDLPKGTLFDGQVSFDIDSAELDEKSREALREAIGKLNADGATFSALIEGHADQRGGAAHNQKLTKRRAEAVQKFLVSNGVSADRLKTHGYGQGYFWMPFDPMASENRRVRIIQCNIDKIDRCKEAEAASRSARATPQR